jgi:FlaA1/EpsC-like NDP-sugar epimerase
MASWAVGTYLSVRFGNVLGSRGSVLTALSAQVAAGGPVTVTHPEVTRYFMTADEAVQLVLQAAVIGRDGEVLVLDMGEQIRIADLVRRLVATVPRQVDIVYTGLRPGEKLTEDLLGEGERGERPHHPLIRHVPVAPLSPAAVLCLGPADALAGLRKALGDDAATGVGRRAPIPPASSDPDAQLTLDPVSRFSRSASTGRLAGPAAR